MQWQLDPTVVKLELELLCAKYGVVEDVYLAPYVEGPRESKARNILKVSLYTALPLANTIIDAYVHRMLASPNGEPCRVSKCQPHLTTTLGNVQSAVSLGMVDSLWSLRCLNVLRVHHRHLSEFTSFASVKAHVPPKLPPEFPSSLLLLNGKHRLQVHAGWARVTFATLEDSERAVLSLPGSDLLGSRIRAHYAMPEPVAEAPPDPVAVAARLELIAARKAQYQRRRARWGNRPRNVSTKGCN